MRLLRIFYAPERVFAELPDKGEVWLLPFLAVLVLALLSAAVVIHMVGMDNIVRGQLEANPRIADQLGQQRINEMARQSSESSTRQVLTYVSAVIATAFSLVVMAGLLLAIMHLADAAAPFGRVLAVCAYAQFAYHAVLIVMTIVILMALTDRGGLDLQDIVRLNPTLFLDKAGTPRFLYSVLSSLDLLSFWAIFLTALGLSKSAAKLSLGKAIVIVAIPWALYVAAKGGMAMLF